MGFEFSKKKPMPRNPESEGCRVKVRRTKNGKELIIGKGCTKDQIQMIKESGEINLGE